MSLKDKIIDFDYIVGYLRHHLPCNVTVRSLDDGRLNYRIFGVVGLPAPDSHAQSGFGIHHQFHYFINRSFINEFVRQPALLQK